MVRRVGVFVGGCGSLACVWSVAWFRGRVVACHVVACHVVACHAMVWEPTRVVSSVRQFHGVTLHSSCSIEQPTGERTIVCKQPYFLFTWQLFQVDNSLRHRSFCDGDRAAGPCNMMDTPDFYQVVGVSQVHTRCLRCVSLPRYASHDGR